MSSFVWVCVRILFLFTICNHVSARLFYWPGQPYITQYKFSEGATLSISNCGDEFDILQLSQPIKFTPESPIFGEEVIIEVEGHLGKDIEVGAYVKLALKYGLTMIYQETLDLCDELKKDENEPQCPLKKGKIVLKKKIKLSKAMPPGTYTVNAHIYSDDDERVTCQTVQANFPRNMHLTSLTSIEY